MKIKRAASKSNRATTHTLSGGANKTNFLHIRVDAVTPLWIDGTARWGHKVTILFGKKASDKMLAFIRKFIGKRIDVRCVKTEDEGIYMYKKIAFNAIKIRAAQQHRSIKLEHLRDSIEAMRNPVKSHKSYGSLHDGSPMMENSRFGTMMQQIVASSVQHEVVGIKRKRLSRDEQRAIKKQVRSERQSAVQKAKWAAPGYREKREKARLEKSLSMSEIIIHND